MNDVRRFDFDVTGCQVEDPLGGYVDHDDYAKLEAEAQALREEVARGNRITVAMALDIAAVGEALGIPGEEQEGGTGEFIDLIHELQEEVTSLRLDKARLDRLDQLNAALNAKYGTTYQWQLIVNHNVNRLMLGHLQIDLSDSAALGLPSCRDALDTIMPGGSAHAGR